MILTVWGYFVRMARRHARRIGVEPEDLVQDFALRVLETADEYDPARGKVIQYAYYWTWQVMGCGHYVRWMQTSALNRLGSESEVEEGEVPVPEQNRFTAPDDAAELADDLARLGEVLDELTPRQRKAITLRFGLGGGEPVVGRELEERLGMSRGANGGTNLVVAGLRKLAVAMGADPAKAKPSRGEGRSLGRLREIRRRAAAVAG